MSNRTLTPQMVLDISVQHIWEQGRAVVANTARCVYRGKSKDGAEIMCAVGVHYTDAEYDSKMEGTGAWTLNLPPRLREHRHLLHDLQVWHDKDTTDNKLAEICKRHGLTMPERATPFERVLVDERSSG